MGSVTELSQVLPHTPWAKSFCPFRACCLRAMPWVRSFWAFSPYLNHMRNFSILTFCLLFPPITERPCGVKIAPRPEKNPPKEVVSLILFVTLPCRWIFCFFLQHEDTLNFSTWQDPGPLLLLRISKV